MKDIFTHIFSHNSWGGTESVSGPGSSVHESQQLINKLPLFFELFEIRTVLDAPCGDFNWMRHVPLSIDKYVGVDIVADLIKQNNEKFKQDHIEFLEKDIIQDELPASDLIICRDALVHLTHEQIKHTIQNFKKSGSTYLLATHFPTIEKNVDIQTGDWRPLNLCIPPFSFPTPVLAVKETLPIKTMSMWRLSDITV